MSNQEEMESILKARLSALQRYVPRIVLERLAAEFERSVPREHRRGSLAFLPDALTNTAVEHAEQATKMHPFVETFNAGEGLGLRILIEKNYFGNCI